MRAQRAKQQELATKEDVFFDDKTGKLVVQGNTVNQFFQGHTLIKFSWKFYRQSLVSREEERTDTSMKSSITTSTRLTKERWKKTMRRKKWKPKQERKLKPEKVIFSTLPRRASTICLLDTSLAANLSTQEKPSGPRVNPKVISDFKMMRSGQESTALIQLTPKVMKRELLDWS